MKIDSISVRLSLPFLGEVSGTWSPDEAEREAAWEMYVELATRVALVPLAADTGLLREALTSLHSLFATTRGILRDHGPEVARRHHGGELSFGHLSVAVLNGTLRPLLSKWHPELLAHESARPSTESPVTWERSWSHEGELRQELQLTQHALADYADLLAIAAEVPPLVEREERAGTA